MRYKFAKFNTLLLIWVLAMGVQAQTTFSAASSNATGRGGTTSYSVGQMVYTTNFATNGSEAQGVQQAYEISGVTGIKALRDVSLYYSVVPNPTTDFLKLIVEDSGIENLSYQLYDLEGKLLETNAIKSNETIINMQERMPAIYIIKVIQHTKEVNSFKIIKH